MRFGYQLLYILQFFFVVEIGSKTFFVAVDGMKRSEGYKVLQMEQQIDLGSDKKFITTRCPIRINKQLLLSSRRAPFIGEHMEHIKATLL